MSELASSPKDGAPTAVEFRLLWHRIRVEWDGPPLGAPSLAETAGTAGPAEFATAYRVEESGDGVLLREQGDEWTACALEQVWPLLLGRAYGRALEVAERRGWMPFRGTTLRRAGTRTCLVGPAEARAALIRALSADVEAAEVFVARDGLVLPVASAALDAPVSTPAEPAHLYCPGEPGPAGASPVLLAALTAAAAGTCTRHADVVAAAARLVGRRPVEEIPPPPGWVGF